MTLLCFGRNEELQLEQAIECSVCRGAVGRKMREFQVMEAWLSGFQRDTGY